MAHYLSNTALAVQGYTDATAPGFEVTVETGWQALFGTGPHRQFASAYAAVSFWPGFFSQGRIIDRATGNRAQRRNVALIGREKNGTFVWRTTPGPKGAIRYGWARTEQEALDAVARWVRRRFAFVTTPETGRLDRQLAGSEVRS